MATYGNRPPTAEEMAAAVAKAIKSSEANSESPERPKGTRSRIGIGTAGVKVAWDVFSNFGGINLSPAWDAVLTAAILLFVAFELWTSGRSRKWRITAIMCCSLAIGGAAYWAISGRIEREAEAARANAQMADEIHEMHEGYRRIEERIETPPGEPPPARAGSPLPPLVNIDPGPKEKAPTRPLRHPKQREVVPADKSGDRNAILSLKVFDHWERPVAATCIVDGVAAFPPYEWKVQAGHVHITCRAEDFDDGFADIDIAAGETKHSKIVMTGKLGALSVLVRDDKDNPINATCWLEGGQPEKEAVNSAGPTGWMRLLIAKHHLRCESPGYESGEGDVMITEGFSTATVRLRKKN